MVRRVEQAQITAAVAVGPQDRLLAPAVREQAPRPEVHDQAGVLLRSPAVLPFVAAGQEPASADGEPGRHDAVDPELLPGRAYVALG